MKKALCTIVTVFILTIATPVIAENAIVQVSNNKGKKIQTIEISCESVQDFVLGIKDLKNGKFRLGYVCKIVDIGFIEKKGSTIKRLHVNMQCKKIFP